MWGATMTLFTPLFVFVASVTQIHIAHNRVIQTTPIKAFTTVQSDYVGIAKKDYILVKSFVETESKRCKVLINDAVSICQDQFKSCTCAPDQDKEILIKALQHDLTETREQLKQSRQHSKLFKYLSIGFASVALSSSAYIILK